MEKLYNIKDNYAEIILNKEIYPLVSIKKAISNFFEDIYVKINDLSEKEYMVQIELKQSSADLEKLIGEFYNELLRESLRYNIAVETKNLRELIVGRALYTTCIDIEQETTNNEASNKLENTEKVKIEDYSLDEIAVNWFDKYGDKEE